MFIPLGEPFSLTHTLTCGQAFRWKKKGEWFCGVVGGHVVMVREGDGGIEVDTSARESAMENYFRAEDGFAGILCELEKDRKLRKALNMFMGLRLLRQDPWECLVSYVCSIASNIPKISQTIENMCEMAGKRMDFVGEAFFSFPTPEALAEAGARNLRRCGLGFRARYVSFLANLITKESVDLDSLRRWEYGEARRELLALPGVGEKVADCVCLFSLDKLEAFPVDRWVRRIMIDKYLNREASDGEIRWAASRRFGKYAGYAQEYLYSYARTLRFK